MFAVIIFHNIYIGLILLNELARDLNNQILFFLISPIKEHKLSARKNNVLKIKTYIA